MAKAFLSHSSADKPLIDAIAKQLGRNKCHYDSLTFEAGNKSIDEIFSGLENTDIFVLFLSEKALQSEWVATEISKAKKLVDKQRISRIFPLIIDKSISYSDERIPDWIKKPYNIKYFNNQVLILKKIDQLLREADFAKYSHLREIGSLFVGRTNLLADFERKVFDIEDGIPSCIIAHSYFDGIGRRTFLKNALVKTNIINKWYEPVYIPISSKESIEDFIYKLNFVEKNNQIFEHDFSKESLEEKITLARKLIKNFADNNALVFIIDDGGIVLPNTIIVPWFHELLALEEFNNEVNICLVSKYKPNYRQVNNIGKIITVQVDELSPNEIQTLFIQLLNLYNIKLSSEDKKFFLSHLHGIPGQVMYAVNLIRDLSLHEAKRLINDIREIDEDNVLALLEFLGDDELSIQLLIALSKTEIISYEIIYQIFGNNDQVSASLQRLFDLSLFYNVSSTHEYLKLNTSVSDYINKANLELKSPYAQNLKDFINKSLEKRLELTANTDYSEFLLSLENMIKTKKSIPAKYFIPSFFLKSIVREYYEGNYDTVIELANQILQFENKFDSQIIRETKYWLCSAYCRDRRKASRQKFFDEIEYFNSAVINQYEYNNLKDYYFLMGFFFRHHDEIEKAEEYFLRVLSIDRDHSRSKRELVNVYLKMGRYDKAFKLAEENYNKDKSNIYHIHAYFICLVRTTPHTFEDIGKLKMLMEKVKRNVDAKSKEFYNSMVPQYTFFVDRKVDIAIGDLQGLLKSSSNNIHAFKALSDIYKRIDSQDELARLHKGYPTLAKQFAVEE